MERLDNDFEPHMVDIPGVKVEGGGFLADDSGLVLRNEPEECRETRERALEAWLVVKDQNTYKLGVVRAYGNIPQLERLRDEVQQLEDAEEDVEDLIKAIIRHK